MADRVVTGRTGVGNTGSPGIEPGVEGNQGAKEDLSERGPQDERMLELGHEAEQGETATPANQETTAGLTQRPFPGESPR